MDFVDELFKAGCGYLGWAPDVVLNTPIPQIMLAIDGRYDFAIKTNPFGGKADPKKKKPDEAAIKGHRVTLDAIKSKAAMIRRKQCQKQPNDS